jgi:hypothetical protein
MWSYHDALKLPGNLLPRSSPAAIRLSAQTPRLHAAQVRYRDPCRPPVERKAYTALPPCGSYAEPRKGPHGLG